MDNNNKKKRVRSLLRVSSKQQLHDNDIPVQRAQIEEFISKKPEWEFDMEYIEKAVSAFKNKVEDRKILMQILNDAKNKEFDILLTFMSDRIGRKEEYSVYVSTLSNLGIEVWTIKEGLLSTEENTDRLMVYLKFWLNEVESRKTGERVKAAQQEMVKKGKHVGGYAPYGYELVYNGKIGIHGRALKELRVVEDQAEVVKEMFRLAVEENLGAHSIAKRLNKSFSSVKGGEWKTVTVADRLKNPIYMGYMTYNRRSHKDTYKRNPVEEWIFSEDPIEELQIVPPDVWYKAQQIREERKQRTKKEEYVIKSSGQLPLMGLAYCGSCGCRLTNGSRYDQWKLKDGTTQKKMSRRYKCTQKANGSILCKGPALYNADEIEDAIFKKINVYMSNLKQSNVYDDIIKNQEKTRKEIKKQINEKQKEVELLDMDIKTLEDQLPKAIRGEGGLSVEKMYTILERKECLKAEIQEEINQKEQEYRATDITNKDIADFAQIIPNWEKEFMESPVHIKKVLLGKIIEKIIIDKEQIKIVFKISEESFYKGEKLGIIDGSGTTPYKLCSV